MGQAKARKALMGPSYWLGDPAWNDMKMLRRLSNIMGVVSDCLYRKAQTDKKEAIALELNLMKAQDVNVVQ